MEGPPVEAAREGDDAITDTEPDLEVILHEPEDIKQEVVDKNSQTQEEEAADPEDNCKTSEEDKEANEKFDMNVDEDDEDEDEDYIDLVANKHMSQSNHLCMFTTGLGFSADDKSRLKAVVESATSKNKFCETFVRHPRLFGLVFRWARRPAYNFAADVLNSNHVVARKVGLCSAFQLCNLRGWIVTRRLRSKDPFHIQYKRFHECLKQADFPPDHRALHLHGIIQSAYDILETSVLPSIAPIIATKRNTTKMNNTSLSAAKKRKSVRASPEFELIHANDPGSFQQRLTQNTKCLQIALFLINFIFASTIPVETVEAKTKLYFSMFSACYSSRRFVELCHGLLVLFDGPTPDPEKVRQLSVHVVSPDSNINLLDYVLGNVSFGPAQTIALRDKILQDIVTKFPKTSLKNYTSQAEERGPARHDEIRGFYHVRQVHRKRDKHNNKKPCLET
jgi:hypothetical protein